jgi:hypothetical protein
MADRTSSDPEWVAWDKRHVFPQCKSILIANQLRLGE